MSDSIKTVVVTGGSGRLGSQIVSDLIKNGYDVISLDMKTASTSLDGSERLKTVVVDLMKYEEVEGAMREGDALIHLAAYADPYCQPAPVIFSNNTVGTYNVLEAAMKWEYGKAVIASSESIYGFPWAPRPLDPYYFPVDEQHPLIPQDWYALSKQANEITADMINRRTGMQVVSLRLSSLLTPEGYSYFYSRLEDPAQVRRILWSYIDIRDAASACILAMELNGLGSVKLNITADETFSDLASTTLIQTYFPEVSDIRRPFESFEALYSNSKAKELLGWKPQYYWRDQIIKKDM
jgi:nucleoside-diphosphate-sugar epimerase